MYNKEIKINDILNYKSTKEEKLNAYYLLYEKENNEDKKIIILDKISKILEQKDVDENE